jgi:hypothetical protein
MAMTFTNRAKHLLIVEFNSGGSVYLAPGETSGPIEEFEINGNHKISKLISYNLMSANPVKEAKEAEAQPNKEDASSTAPKTEEAPASEASASDTTASASSGETGAPADPNK